MRRFIIAESLVSLFQIALQAQETMRSLIVRTLRVFTLLIKLHTLDRMHLSLAANWKVLQLNRATPFITAIIIVLSKPRAKNLLQAVKIALYPRMEVLQVLEIQRSLGPTLVVLTFLIVSPVQEKKHLVLITLRVSISLIVLQAQEIMRSWVVTSLQMQICLMVLQTQGK